MGGIPGPVVQRFLIDECLSLDLVAVAHNEDLAATHVGHIGKLGISDRALIPIILSGEYVFVTNNRHDFVALYEKLDLHNGLVIILPSVAAKKQSALFFQIIQYIKSGVDIVNQLLEIDEGGNISCTPWPKNK
jgi:hypothetical protein